MTVICILELIGWYGFLSGKWAILEPKGKATFLRGINVTLCQLVVVFHSRGWLDDDVLRPFRDTLNNFKEYFLVIV